MEIHTPIILGIGFFSFIPFVISLWNFKFLTKPRLICGVAHSVQTEPSVTVLIPARNEEENIVQVLSSLREQTYINYDVIVLNDRSEDRTAELVNQFLKTDLKIQLIEGEPTPSGWLGKHWACHQLSLEASGDLWLFIDADTLLGSDAIRSAVNETIIEQSDLLTMIPSRKANNFIEKGLYGFIDWAILAWLPIQVAYWSKNSYLSASYGQFMLFKKGSYISSGGHKKIKDVTVDDLGLGRLMKKSGLSWVLKDGTNIVTALPYQNLIETVKGISRSLAPALGNSITLIILISTVLMSIFFIPLIYLSVCVIETNYIGTEILISFIGLNCLLASCFISCKKVSHNMFLVLLFHVIVIFMILIAYHSLLSQIFKFAKWKGRSLASTSRIKF